MRRRFSSCGINLPGFVLTLLFPVVAAAGMHPVESEIRRLFPSVPLDSTAIFQAGDAPGAGQPAAGLRARFPQQALPLPPRMPSLPPMAAADPALNVLYPHSFNGLIVAELGSQRVVLRARGASGAAAAESNGKLVYARPYPSTDVVEIPRGGRSEELLLLHDDAAPLVFEFEIVTTAGVGSVVLDDGAIRFQPKDSRAPNTADSVSGHFIQPEPLLQIDRPWILDRFGRRSETLGRWTLLGDGPIPSALRLTITDERLDFPILVDPSFSYSAGSMATARQAHTATLLPNGKVLIAGGSNGSSLAFCEIYDPTTNLFTVTGSLAAARVQHTATLLRNGKVLIAGGFDGMVSVASAELYDPSSGTFAPTGSLTSARYAHTATLLPNGKVLIVGGYVDVALGSAELYDPATGIFTPTGSLNTPRGYHTATLLPNGKVLIAGGFDGSQLTSAELYDPGNGTFQATASLGTGRYSHTATLLRSGKVLVAGGMAGAGQLASAELYDPTIPSFTGTTGNLTAARAFHTATLLPNGKVLLDGGGDGATQWATVSECYDPNTGTFAQSGGNEARRFHTATMLHGRVLIVGGAGSTLFTTNLLFDPATPALTTTGSSATARSAHSATILPDGRVLIAGGGGSQGTPTRSAELYDSATGMFAPTGDMLAARSAHTATLLPNGKVFVAGGRATTDLASTELYDPGTQTFVASGDLATGRSNHTATLLSDGKVLIAGGNNSSGALASAELYDPAAGSFTPTGSLLTARSHHTATLLPNGKVLIAGGTGPAQYLSSAELYDPATGVFTVTGLQANGTSRAVARADHSATLLPSGSVLLAGGYGSAGPMRSADSYDIATGTFQSSYSFFLATARADHTATLLPNGDLLFAGGNDVNGALASVEIAPMGTGGQTVGTLTAARTRHTATPLPSGKVLFACGSGAGLLSSAELYDPGAGFQASQRPAITTAPASLTLPAELSLSGSGFLDSSEGSTGGANSSPSNMPLVQLVRIDNERIVFPGVISFTDGTWSALLSYMPAGAYRATMFTNGIPSLQQIIRIYESAPTIASVSPNRGVAAGGQSVTITGTYLSGASVTIGGSAGTVTQTTSTSVTFITPAHAVGVVDVTVRTPSGTWITATGAFTYLANPPTNVIATATTPSLVTISWTAATGATSYQVLRSSDGVTYSVLATVSTPWYADDTVVAGTAYLYEVRASTPVASDLSAPDLATTVMFTDDAIGAGTITRATHLIELRTAVTAVCALAGIGPAFTTDPTLGSGLAIKAAHMAELRASLGAARAALELPAVPYARPTPTPGSTIYASDVTDLRSGVK